ncbi:hypothetical protein IE53DRAFT_389696 [Violaceomyces palustris]|uniref:Uncharacterized protein n=1 Tax=Violaceomyces palustris TaxID=1673888 RepID=A0ACD0NQQ1_9BASI|nr:hypothetical protein IE53DRAFT_389696 [Violaceomyces palustris]
MSATNAARLSSQKRSSNVNLALAAAQQQNRMSVVQPQARRHSTLLYLKDGKPIAPASARYSIAPQPNATVSAWPSGSGEVVPPSLPKRLRPLENVPSHASLTQEKAMNAVQRAPMLRALNAGTGVAPMRHVSIGGQTARKAASSSLQYSSSVDAPESKSEDRTIRQSSEPPMPSPGARSNASTAQSSPRFGTPTLSISVEEAKPMPSSPSNQIRTHPPNMACFAGCCHSQRESSEVAPMSFIQLDEPPRSPLLPTTPSTLADLSPSPTSSIPNSNTSGNLPNSPTLRTVGSKSSLRKLASLGNLKLSKNNPSAKNDIVPTSSWSSTSEGQGKEQQENQGGGAKTQGSTTTPSDSTSLPAGTSGCDSLPTTATTATTPKRKGTLKRVGKSLTRINKALVKAVVSPGNCGGPSSTSFSVTSATAANPAPLAVSNQDCKERGEGNRKSSDEESEVWGPRTELGDDCFDGTLECISPPCIDRQARAGEAVDKATCVGELKAQSEGTSLPWASSGPNEDMDQDRFADAVESIDPMDGGLFPDPKYDFGPPQIRMLSCSSQDPDSTASTAEMSLPFGFGIGLAMLGGNDGRHRNEARSLFSYQSSYIPTSRPDREARYNTCITGPRDRIGSGTKSASSGTTTPSLVSSSPTFTDKSESERGTPASEEEDAERGEDEEGKRFETPISSPWLSDNGKVHWVHQPDDCRKSRNQYDESMEFLTDQNNRTSQNGCGQDESSISVQTRTGGPAFEKVGGFRVNFPIQVLPPLDSIGFYVGRH